MWFPHKTDKDNMAPSLALKAMILRILIDPAGKNQLWRPSLFPTSMIQIFSIYMPCWLWRPSHWPGPGSQSWLKFGQ